MREGDQKSLLDETAANAYDVITSATHKGVEVKTYHKQDESDTSNNALHAKKSNLRKILDGEAVAPSQKRFTRRVRRSSFKSITRNHGKASPEVVADLILGDEDAEASCSNVLARSNSKENNEARKFKNTIESLFYISMENLEIVDEDYNNKHMRCPCFSFYDSEEDSVKLAKVRRASLSHLPREHVNSLERRPVFGRRNSFTVPLKPPAEESDRQSKRQTLVAQRKESLSNLLEFLDERQMKQNRLTNADHEGANNHAYCSSATTRENYGDNRFTGQP